MVVYLNAQSCRNKMSELNDIVTNHEIDMKLLTETRLKEQGDEALKAEMTPAGFVLKSFPTNDRRRGGLAFLIKKKKKSKKSENHIVLKPLSFSTVQASEARVVYNTISTTLIHLYHSPYSKQ